jgi:hypothetical protein
VPKHSAEQELRQIEQQIASYLQGVGITGLEKALSAAGMVLNRRSLLRRLSVLSRATAFAPLEYSILSLHALLSDNLLPNPEACGMLRQIAVGIGGSVYTPLSTPQLLDEYFQRVLDTAAAITDPFEQSFFALVHLSYLQPFEDVNKRVARLSANIPLIENNLCPLSFIDVPKRAYVEGILGVYKLNRIELLRDIFVWGYERSVKRYLSAREELGEPDPFRLKYRSALTEVIRYVVLKPCYRDSGICQWMDH